MQSHDDKQKKAGRPVSLAPEDFRKRRIFNISDNEMKRFEVIKQRLATQNIKKVSNAAIVRAAIVALNDVSDEQLLKLILHEL